MEFRINDFKEESRGAIPGSDDRMVRTTNAVLRVVAGEHLLVPIRGGHTLDAESLYILDDVGVWAWEAMARPQTLRELVAGVEDAFDVPAGQDVEADLRELLADMVAEGLVKQEAAV